MKIKKTIPPHLPPPSCNISSHRRWQSIKILLVATCFGLLAGLTGALMVLGWIWPMSGGGDMWVVNNSKNNSSQKQMEERIRKERIDNRIFSVYDNAVPFANVNYFSAETKLGEAMVISTDGWLVMYLPDYDGGFKRWKVLTQNGAVYNIEKALFDKYAEVVYFKIEAKAGSLITERVMDFNYNVDSFDDVFVYQQGLWWSGSIGYKIWGQSVEAHLDTAPQSFYTLNKDFQAGSIVVNDQGKVAGLVVKNNLLLPNIYLTRIIPGVLSESKITYNSLGVDGWYASERQVIVDNNFMNGFLVGKVWSVGNLLKRGDVLLEINGQIVDPDVLWYNINDEKAQLKIWRNGKVLELEVKIVAN